MSTNRDMKTRRAGVVAALLATVALLAAACSSGGGSSSGSRSPSAGGSSRSASAVAYSACMRSHGVPNYPDPDSHGNLTKQGAQQLGVSESQLQSAQQACQHLLPDNSGALNADSLRQCESAGNCSHALVQWALTGGRKFAQCMRNHGVPKWPDPKTTSEGQPFFPVYDSGLSHSYTHSQQLRSKAQQCISQSGAVALPMG
jgi:hypothetical protein